MAGSADAATPTLQWINPLQEEWQFSLLNQEYGRQIDLYWNEVMPSREWVPEKEWEVIWTLSTSLVDALEFAISDGEELLKMKEKERGNNILKQPKEGGGSSDENCSNPTLTQETDIMEESKTGGLGIQERISQASGRDPWAIKGCKSDQCDIYELNAARGCNKHSYNTIHNETSWLHMRAAYIATVGPRQSTIKAVYGSGMQVPYRIGHSPGRGRGIYATERIPKGTVVWKAEYTAAFSTGIQYRRFLASLPDVLACDMMNWCYTSKDKTSESVARHIECDLDEASLFNSFDERAEYTIGCHKSFVENYPEDCLTLVFALRDIEELEELVTDYNEFSEAEWSHFGL